MEQSDATIPLAFPCLITSGDRLIPVSRGHFSRYVAARHVGGNIYLLKWGASDRLRTSWLLDRYGLVREVKPLHLHRTWARPIRRLWDLTLLECEIQPGKRVTVAELLEKLVLLKAPREFRTVADLTSFLRKQPWHAAFDAKMFRQFWDRYGFRLAPEEWSEEYPDSQVVKR
jgi:hypothetical protein